MRACWNNTAQCCSNELCSALVVSGARADPEQALAVRALMTIRRLLLKWPHLHEAWANTWQLEGTRTLQARPHGPIGTLRRILHRLPQPTLRQTRALRPQR